MKRLPIVAILVISLALWGCAGMSDTEQRTLSGGAMGTAAGAVVGAISGHTLWGAAIGAAAGSAGGFLLGKHQEATKNAYQQGFEAGKKQSQQ